MGIYSGVRDMESVRFSLVPYELICGDGGLSIQTLGKDIDFLSFSSGRQCLASAPVHHSRHTGCWVVVVVDEAVCPALDLFQLLDRLLCIRIPHTTTVF